MATLKQLRDRAAQLGIKGRWDMGKKQLENAIEKAKYGKVVRKGVNLSGNVPYQGKLYSFTARVNETELSSQPKQVQQLVHFMKETGIEARGGDIISRAVKAGAIKTKIKDPRELFGYYAKRLVSLGAAVRYEHGFLEKKAA